MCDVRLSGLTRIEECRLRFELSRKDDPFVDATVTIDAPLAAAIALLQRVQTAVGEAETQAIEPRKKPTSGTPRAPVTSVASTPLDESEAPERKNTRWKGIVEALCSGELDVFTRREKSPATAATVKWSLGKTFPGLEVTTAPAADGLVLLSVRQGSYRFADGRRAA